MPFTIILLAAGMLTITIALIFVGLASSPKGGNQVATPSGGIRQPRDAADAGGDRTSHKPFGERILHPTLNRIGKLAARFTPQATWSRPRRSWKPPGSRSIRPSCRCALCWPGFSAAPS